jgi:hypothetical protein
MSNFLALCQKFRRQTGISGSGPTSVTSQTGMNEKIVEWIADADHWVQEKWSDWSFLLVPQQVITVPAATNTRTLAQLSITDLARWVKDSFVANPGTDSYDRLSFMTYDDYLASDKYLGEEDSGDIDTVIINPTDNSLIFYPTPTGETTVWAAYYKVPTRMVAATDEPLFPTRFEQITINRAKMYYAEYIEDPSLFQAAQIRVDELLPKLESVCLPEREDFWLSTPDTFQDVAVE